MAFGRLCGQFACIPCPLLAHLSLSLTFPLLAVVVVVVPVSGRNPQMASTGGQLELNDSANHRCRRNRDVHLASRRSRTQFDARFGCACCRCQSIPVDLPKVTAPKYEDTWLMMMLATSRRMLMICTNHFERNSNNLTGLRAAWRRPSVCVT